MFIGGKKGESIDVTMNVKHEKGGCFLLLLCSERNEMRKCKCLCFPMGANGVSWRSLFSSLSWVFNVNPGVSVVEIRRREVVEKNQSCSSRSRHR